MRGGRRGRGLLRAVVLGPGLPPRLPAPLLSRPVPAQAGKGDPATTAPPAGVDNPPPRPRHERGGAATFQSPVPGPRQPWGSG